MKINRLSDYEKFILIGENTHAIHANIGSFQQFKELLQALELCGKGDSSNFLWRDKIVEKPVDRYEASKLLADFSEARWNKQFVTVSRSLGLELR